MIRSRTTLVLVLLAFVAAWAIPSSASAASFGSRSLKVNTRGKDVKALQRALTTLGFSTRANGVFGPPTRKSVKRLEKRQRWPINGVVTRKDAKRILKLVARRKAAKATTVYYLYGGNYPTVAVSGAQAGAGRLDVVDVISGQVVAAIPVSFSAVGQQDVIWSETTPSGGFAPDSTYQIRVGDPGTAGISLVGGATRPFLLRSYAFPVRGKHGFGGAASRFGAPRSGHIHQGQDVSAACGVPLVAAQGGTVKVVAYQAGGAGYYVVIAGVISGTDTVYMHLMQPSPLVQGSTIYTGQALGVVGATGAASGCHLHFEHWTYPGWYTGGAPYDPLAELQYWDSYS